MSSIPELFRCPISLDLFVDPVTLSTGLTYDRPSIEQWLARGNLTCPVTMQRLRDTTLVPNRTLRHLIHQWLLSTLNTIDYADPNLELLVLMRKVKSLADESDKARNFLLELGILPLLLRLLSKWRQREELVEDVLNCVICFASDSHMGYFNVLLQQGNMDAVVELLEQGGIPVKVGLCEVISLVAGGHSRTRELCLALGQNRRVVRILVSVLALVTTSAAAARAIAGLCAAAGENREVAVEEGAVEGLVEYMWRGGGREAVAAVEQLAKVERGREKLVRSENGIRVVVKMVFRVSSTDDAGSEHAVGCLWSACCVSTRARAEAVAAGALSQLLLLLQSQCGCKAKAKARALLKLLTSTHNDRDSS